MDSADNKKRVEKVWQTAERGRKKQELERRMEIRTGTIAQIKIAAKKLELMREAQKRYLIDPKSYLKGFKFTGLCLHCGVQSGKAHCIPCSFQHYKVLCLLNGLEP